MKKLFAICLAILGIALVSCAGADKQDLESRREDSVSAEIKELYNLNFDDATNSKAIYVGDERKDSYYDIYLAADPKASLFVYNLNIDEKIDSHLKSFPVNTLIFAHSIYDDEKQAFISEFYNSDYGIPSYDLGFTVDTSKAMKGWSKTVTNSYVADANEELEDDINISIAYLPTYFVRTYKNNVILKAYVFVPVYVAFTANNQEIVAPEAGSNDKFALQESKLSTLEEVELIFNADKPAYLATTLPVETE